jgi:zinc protease
MSARGRALAAPLRFDVDGGSVALLESSRTIPLVSIVVALRCGSAADPAEKAGLARIAVRMLRRGCEGMTAEQIDFRIDALGAEMAVDSSPSTVAIHAQVIARNLAPFVDLLVRLLSDPTFPADEFERMKRETVAEIIEARDNDRVVAQKAFHRTIFAGHPYGNNPGGTVPSVSSIERDDVVAFYRRYVVKRNIVIGIAGDVDPDRAPEVARALVSRLAEGKAASDGVSEPTMPPGRRLVVVDKPERTQTQIIVGTLGTSAHDPDHVDMVIANAAFGGTFTSRLTKEVRSKRGWSYGASSRISVDRHRQTWSMWTFPAVEHAALCLELSLKLFEAWVESGVSSQEVSFIKRYLVRSHAFEIDTAAKRLHQGLDVELLSLPPDYYSGWVERVLTVDAGRASAAIKERIKPDDLLSVVVGTATQVLDPLRAVIPRLSQASVVPFDAE